MKIYQYYAAALNDQGKIGQLKVTAHNGRTTQEWTGITYDTEREAKAAILKINCVWRLARAVKDLPATYPAHVAAAIGLTI